MQPGIMELDLHGKNTYQARVAIDAALRRCDTVAGYSKYVDFIRDLRTSSPPSARPCGTCAGNTPDTPGCCGW